MEKNYAVGNNDSPIDYHEVFVNFYGNLMADYNKKLKRTFTITVMLGFFVVIENTLLLLYFLSH